MHKLLMAGLFRLKKSIMFWLFIFFTIGIAGYTLFRHSVNDGTPLDILVNEFIVYIGLFIAIFVSIFVGKEYSEGIIRNKIIVGHSRANIYLSELIISIVTAVICEIIYLIMILTIGTLMYGKLQMSILQFSISILNTILIIIAYCSIFNFVTMLCSEITVSTTICLLLFITMFIVQGSLGLTVNSKKYIEHTFYDENGNRYVLSQEPNPNYPGDQKVKIAKVIYLLIPNAQANEVQNNSFENTNQMPFYSISLIIVVNIVGIYLFSKKELK